MDKNRKLNALLWQIKVTQLKKELGRMLRDV